MVKQPLSTFLTSLIDWLLQLWTKQEVSKYFPPYIGLQYPWTLVTFCYGENSKLEVWKESFDMFRRLQRCIQEQNKRKKNTELIQNRWIQNLKILGSSSNLNFFFYFILLSAAEEFKVFWLDVFHSDALWDSFSNSLLSRNTIPSILHPSCSSPRESPFRVTVLWLFMLRMLFCLCSPGWQINTEIWPNVQGGVWLWPLS